VHLLEGGSVIGLKDEVGELACLSGAGKC
jgi:hypothetical protein